ncbi:TPA: DNA-binding domain-containing protein [Enterobacter bugandensis]|uniref:conjugal transfer nickase/helicase domain-containing protein n=1 Tax=Enterobacter TaxID=547 RepID=UPI000F88E8B2|nr:MULTISPECIES: DNA-binding domain-containing protein [Enterobacter]EHN8825907.1 DNA-binding domain-containing protein [Enterobacter bugandensis]EHN8844145.1 DNA-binding domain-containing protein [Enterobacter bugandensis]MBE4805510.1 DNA-binding domain-containing protein [Enterobacter cloacae complex sp. P43RS]MCK6700723.1 DNA-binding domain-containing protein [Enterobacter bugandensis]MCK6777015.1 DNA-binding domain-containing protein [Enterobacter bugandensis]
MVFSYLQNIFFAWHKAGSATRSLTLNASRSLAHLVDGKLFLVSPDIFKQYHKETRGDAGEKGHRRKKTFRNSNFSCAAWTVQYLELNYQKFGKHENSPGLPVEQHRNS